VKVFLVVTIALSFLATCFMESKAVPGVVGLVAVVAFIKILLNEIAKLQEEENRSIDKIDDELYDENEKTEE